jgi:hypothetical protein
MNWKEWAAQHVKALAIAGALVFAGRIYLQDHDARLKADETVKTAQATIDGLQKQAQAVQAVAARKVVILQKEAATVKTGPQALEHLPELDMPELRPEPMPDPERVSVQVVPLYQDLNACKQCSIELEATKQALELQTAISKEKDTEITALKRKPSFLKRLGRAALVTGCAAGGSAAGSLAGAKGAAIGGAVGAGACQLF